MKEPRRSWRSAKRNSKSLCVRRGVFQEIGGVQKSAVSDTMNVRGEPWVTPDADIQ